MAAFIKNPVIIEAGPFIVIDTEVFESARLKPLYNFFASSRQQIETPLFPILP